MTSLVTARDIAALTTALGKEQQITGALVAALEDVEEYFADRADADHNGERYVPNTEMRLLGIVRDALAAVAQ